MAINNVDTAWSATFSTGLPVGSYCNVIEGAPSLGVCEGTSYVRVASRRRTVVTYCICRFWIGLDGSLTVTIGPRQAVAVHVGAMGIGSPTPKAASPVSVIFSEAATTTPGEVSTISFVAVLSDQTYCTVNHALEYIRGRQHTATR